MTETELHITSELEIKQLFDGLKNIIYHCLDIEQEGVLSVKEEFNYMDVEGLEGAQSLAD